MGEACGKYSGVAIVRVGQKKETLGRTRERWENKSPLDSKESR
jgi:hypothetical protein